MIQATRAIVLKTIKYGETSLIVTLYTELFGIQTCIVQGVRKSTKKSPAKSNYFAIGTVLQISIYYQVNKKLQRIRDYSYDAIYTNISNSIIKNAIILMIMEIVHHSLHEPEPNEELFEWLQELIQHIDGSADAKLTWLPHFFCVQYAAFLGFSMQGICNADTPVLHLQDGIYIPMEQAVDCVFSAASQSQVIYALSLQSLHTLGDMQIPTYNKRLVLHDAITYLQLHITQMPNMKSIDVLESIFN
jgi:DNA repair protein RecO (recombination protein O)